MSEASKCKLSCDPPHARKRREAIAQRALGCRVATPRLWWSLSDIWEAIDGPGWRQRPTLGKFYQEFLDALQAGTFDRHGKTRVMVLSPRSVISLEAPWPQIRLTRERVKRISETQSASVASVPPIWHFGQHYGRHILIEIGRAYIWLAAWLDPAQVDAWLHIPNVGAALSAGAEIRPKRRLPPLRRSAQVVMPIRTGDEVIDAAMQWLVEIGAEMVAHGARLTRNEAYDLARQKVGSALSKTTFMNRVWPSGAPSDWKKRGARTKAQREIAHMQTRRT